MHLLKVGVVEGVVAWKKTLSDLHGFLEDHHKNLNT